ncbi:MAG: hypothetical protein JXX14_24480 [Deltaproteobacteria bacterium]|nr:hypothetical protein [Deltaproteobacteria bacterium]
MKRIKNINKIVIGAALLLGIFMMTRPAIALDAAYSRKGPFTGIGFIGGGGVLLGDENVGLGDLGLNLQLGLGVTENLTVSLNVDNRLQIGNNVVQGMIIPGPEFSIFVAKNLYVNFGVGLAMGLKTEPQNDNAIGMNMGASFGYEHFVNTNIAAYIGIGMDYTLLSDADDLLMFGVLMGIRYY